MNPSPLAHTVGNVSTALAAILYALPLQYLLFELARKREDGGGALAGIFILVPMWLLLMTALLCVTTSGGFDWLRLGRGWLGALAVFAIIAMAIVSFARFETVPNATRGTRLLVNSLINVLPLLTLLLVTINLNPRFAPGIPLKWVSLPWIICAGTCLTLGVGFVGYRMAAAGGSRLRGIVHRLGNNSELSRQFLATIPTLDPQRDFTELLRFTDDAHSGAVREAALAQLRRHPDFAARLVTELTTATPSSGELNHALDAVGFATFTPDEQKLLALPCRHAMGRITNYIRSELRYFTKDRRKGTQNWGNRLFPSIATKFAGTGVDFQPALTAFEKTFATPDGSNVDETAPTEPQ